MTADQNSDTEAAPKTAPKNPRRSTAKTQSRKKTTSSASLTTEENSSPSTSEKKKISARRPRKKPVSTQNSTQEDNLISTEEKNTAEAVNLVQEEATVSSKSANTRAVRSKSLSTRTTRAKRTPKTESSTVEAENITALAQDSLLVKEESKSEAEKMSNAVAPKATKAGRGRPKKVRPEEVSPAEETLTLEPAVSDEPQSAGIERAVTEVPEISHREEKKTRRPRRNVKAKSALTQEEIPVAVEASEKTENDEEKNASEQEDTSLSAAKSRRGRRGGRGKRGKKRPLALLEEAQDLMDDEDEEEFSSRVQKSVSLTKGGTSLGEGKPGRARTLPVKKPVEGVQRKMFISMVQGEQVEVALVENGIIHEYYLEMLHQVKTKGNIYKGVVNNIDANLQAAFVSYGANKNGFLQIDEIHPEYYQSHHDIPKGKKFPPIQKIIKPGQEILVQVVKEPTGNKGAFLTTWLSLPGRFLVLTPGQEQIGISRKVESDEERGRLREMMSGIEPGAGLGVIVRTVSAGTSKTTLKSDLQYLKRVWKEIRKRGVSDTAPALLYRESSLAERAIRDYLTDDVTEVWVDNTEVAESLRETVALLFPRKKELIRTHADVRQTLWERFNMHRQLEQIYAREVVLPSGGRLVFDQTEALMAIDINSGKISGKGNFESMALKTNIEAAEAIARHLKLRDIGGQVVVDFIEMRDKSHVREVEKTLRNAMKNDRARHDVARISSFGLLEIVRQRTGSSALAITMEPCPHCRGTGVRRNLEWQALQALCEMERKGRSAQHGKFVYETTSAELALYLLNHKRQRISELEEQLRVSIEIRLP